MVYSTVRVEALPDGRSVTTLLVGDGQVRAKDEPPSDSRLRACLGFRTPELEKALLAVVNDERYRLVVEEPAPWTVSPGTVLNGADLLRLIEWQWGGDACEGDPGKKLHDGFVDTLFTVPMKGGRVVRVTAFSARLHYELILEGSPDRAAHDNGRRYHEARAREHGEPLVTIEPALIPMASLVGGPTRYPRHACVASLKSAPIDPEMVWSALTLLWWEERLNKPLSEVVAAALAGVDWEAKAKDFDLW
jgi:hypothetical protein